MLILATFMLVIGGDKKIVVKMFYIYYPVRFKEKQVKALLDSGSKVNVMNPHYA